MIVYNVERRFFAMKTDADKYRKQLGLKPDALTKLVIDNRVTLAGLLDAVCSLDGNEPHPIADEVTARAQPTVSIPEFLRKDWEKFQKMAEGR